MKKKTKNHGELVDRARIPFLISFFSFFVIEFIFFFWNWIWQTFWKKNQKFERKKSKKICNFCLGFFSDYFFSFFLFKKYNQNNLVQVLCFFFFFFLLVFCFSLKCLNKLLTLFEPELLLKDSFNKDFCLIEEFLLSIACGTVLYCGKKDIRLSLLFYLG